MPYQIIDMKKLSVIGLGLAMLVGVTVAFQSAGKGKTKGVYKLDANASELKWKADKADNSHGHNGTIKISNGTAKFNGTKFESAQFEIDMKSIDSELTPENGEGALLGHLSNEDFFQSANFPKTIVKVTSWTENEMSATVTIVGKELKTTFPVTTTSEGGKMTTKGTFTLDVSSLGIPGFTPDPEMEKEKPGQYINPLLQFDMNLVMKGAGK